MNELSKHIPWPMPFLKADQIAFIARSDADEIRIKKTLGLTNSEWIEDQVVAKGFVEGYEGEQENVAKLQFCYAYGIEVEILRYIDGPNYPDLEGKYIPSCRLGHIGFHVDKGTEVPAAARGFMFPSVVVQSVVTQSHTNQFLIDSGRRYRYEIYNTTPLFGFHLKTIERIEK